MAGGATALICKSPAIVGARWRDRRTIQITVISATGRRQWPTGGQWRRGHASIVVRSHVHADCVRARRCAVNAARAVFI